MRKFPLAAAALLVCAVAGPARAQQPLSLDNPAARPSVQERCAEAAAEVRAGSADEWRLACEAAAQALHLLARCHIAPRSPVRIELSGEVRRPLGGVVFGLFDPKQEKVLITQYAKVASLAGGTPFSDLPRPDFYRSMIVHEVIHAVMHQNYKRPPASHAAYEYAAYALQIESLSPDVRKVFLETVDIGVDESEFAFNDAILAFDPFFFAARAYEHFRASPDGCAHLGALLAGDAAFIWVRGPSR
jgi:hypothetical protein